VLLCGMTSVRIPQEHELRSRLSGLGVLLTARKWERAAIVYAFTEVGEVGRGRWYKPQPPKMHIRDFAAKGYAGLTTNKSVSRYRDAWVTAINNGWAVPVVPGMAVLLPEQPFPAWPYGTTFPGGDVTVEVRDDEVVDINAYRTMTTTTRMNRALHMQAMAEGHTRGGLLRNACWRMWTRRPVLWRDWPRRRPMSLTMK
jgi:hypothetical protein